MTIAVAAAAQIAIAAPLRTAMPEIAVQPQQPAPEMRQETIREEIAAPNLATAVQARLMAGLYDNRVTGPTQTVASFDRMAMVIEGFEHIREIFEANRQQAREDFGVEGIDGMGLALAAAGTGAGAEAADKLDLRA